MTASDGRDVVFTFSYVTWDGARRRGMSFAQDQLAQRLLESPCVRRLVVANWFRSLPFAAGRAVLLRDGQPFPTDERATLHQPLRLRRHDPVSLHAVERTYRTYDRRLRRAADHAGLVRPAVITAHPLVAGFAPLDWASSVTFYATDDWRSSPEYRRWHPAFEEAYSRIRTTRRRVCAVSEAIIERIGPTGPHAVVPNGVAPGEWAERPVAARTWLATLPRPRVLYLGTLDSRLDADLVKSLSERFPRGSIVLVGPVTDRDHVERCARPANVHVRPAVARERVPDVLSDADLGVIPHACTPFTSAMSPLKLYEYLAAGRPVAAVDLAPISGVKGRVVLAGNGRSFADAASEALALGPATEEERLRFVKENSWAGRHDQLLALALATSSVESP